MGPQFSFAVYASTGHTSAQLFNPNESNGCITTIQKCCPVLIEKTPSLGILNGVETSLDSTSRIICGSWSSEVDIRTVYTDGTYSLVKEKIEDAIRCDMGTVLEDEIVEVPYFYVLITPFVILLFRSSEYHYQMTILCLMGIKMRRALAAFLHPFPRVLVKVRKTYSTFRALNFDCVQAAETASKH